MNDDEAGCLQKNGTPNTAINLVDMLASSIAMSQKMGTPQEN